MTQAPAALKDAKLQRYYDSLFAMHGSEGWRELMVDVEYMEGTHNQIDNVSTVEELYTRKGELNIIRWLKTHKDRTEAAYAHILEEDSGADAPESTGGVAKVIS